jgi:hypothetical protein
MKTIRLDGYHDITISDEAFTLIQDIVKDGIICGTCQQPITEDYPCVALNTCLECFLKFHNHGFIGEVADYASGHTYAFSDSRGYISLSHSSWDAKQLAQSIYWTIKLHNFPLPEEYNGQPLYQHDWHLYGNFQMNAVIVIEYREEYGERRNIFFLASKDGTLIAINKRKKVFQKLWKQARERIEATKDKRGYYHLEDYSFSQVYDSHLFTIVSDMVSADTKQLTQLQA